MFNLKNKKYEYQVDMQYFYYDCGLKSQHIFKKPYSDQNLQYLLNSCIFYAFSHFIQLFLE